MTLAMMLTRAQFLRVSAAAIAGGAHVATAFTQRRSTMLTRPIPSSGIQLPVVSVGTWRGFDVGADPSARAQRAEVLRALFDAGGRVIDSSPMYGSSEDVAGALLTQLKSHDRAFVATKVWTEGREAGIAQMEASMHKLQHPRIELMQIHNLVDWRTHLDTLRGWKREGRIGHLGITHYRDDAHAQLEAVIGAELIDSVQLNYSIDNRASEARLLPLAADRGVAVLVNLPFGGGGLLKRVQGKPLPPWAVELGCRTWAQILLKYVIANPSVTCVIPGTSRPEHMRENAEAGAGTLPDPALRQRMIAAFK